MELPELLAQFAAAANSISKVATKEKVNRKQILKSLDKNNGKRSMLTEKVDALEKNKAALERNLEATKAELSQIKKEIKQFHTALRGMDLSNASDVVFYDDDIGYVVGDKEHHLEEDDTGDVNFIQMNLHRKSLKDRAEAERTKLESEKSQAESESKKKSEEDDKITQLIKDFQAQMKSLDQGDVKDADGDDDDANDLSYFY